MDGNIIGLVAVTLFFGIPLRGHVHLLPSSQVANRGTPGGDRAWRQRPHGTRSIGGRTFATLGNFAGRDFLGIYGHDGNHARSEPDAAKALAVGIVPFAAGLGFLLDFALIRKDLKAAASHD